MPKTYILKPPDFKDLKEPCITGTMPDVEKIIYDAKINIPLNYFDEKGTYCVIPTDGRLAEPVYHGLTNGASFDITRDIFSATGDRPYYLHINDRVKLFDNDGVEDWNYFDYDAKERSSYGFPPILNKQVKELLLLEKEHVFVTDTEKDEIIEYSEKQVLKTKPTDMRELGRKIIPVLKSSR